jgi:hypothetical protein
MDSAASAAGEQFQHAPTTTTTSCLDHLPRRNNNRRKERRYDNFIATDKIYIQR